MKKVLGFIIGIAFWQIGFAQIVVDGSGFISPGTILNYESASPAWLLDQDLISTDGEGVVWNISNWESSGITTETYGSVDTLPFINQLVFNNEFLYPESYSTVVLPVGQDLLDLPLPIEISDGYSYFRNDETGYYNTGSSFEVSGFPLTTPNDSVERIYKFPMQYGDTDASSLAYFISLPTLGAYGQNGTRMSEVDGSGVLNTPYGTYNVLRVRAVVNITDTLFVEQFGFGQTIVRPEQIDYAWISPDVAGPVLKMSVINGAVISAELLNNTLVSVSTVNRVGVFKVYPNPAGSFISIKADSPVLSLSIYNSVGKLMLSQKMTGSSVDINNLDSGIYFVEIQLENGQRVVEKFVKSR